MRTFYISSYSPYPEYSGHSRRIASNHRALCSLGECRLAVLGYKPALDIRQRLYGSSAGAVIYPPRIEGPALRAARHLAALSRGESAWLAKSLSWRRVRDLVDEVRRFRPDAVILGDTWLSPLIRHLAPSAGQVVVDNHNAESRLYERIAGNARGLGWVKAAFTARNMRQMERLLPAATRLWAVSDEDRRFFGALVDESRISLIPNVVDIGSYRDFRTAERPRSIAYVGSYGYAPNRQAALSLITISKQMRQRGIEHELWIIGNSPVPEMYRAAEGHPHITITGFVDDIRAYVAQSALVMAPLSEGSGTKFKLLEAMALGRPIITTSIGAEGLGVRPGEDMVVVKDDAGFIDQAAALLGDPTRRRAIGEAARCKVAEHFSMDVLVERIQRSLAA